MASLRLWVQPKVERSFKATAKAMHPREAYAVLLGTVAGDSVYVEDLYVPEDLDKYSSLDRVEIRPEWMVDAAEQAADDELICVGDCHSHAYRKRETVFDPVQSARDIELQGGFFIYGICNVVEGKRGLRATIRYWGPTIQIKRI